MVSYKRIVQCNSGCWFSSSAGKCFKTPTLKKHHLLNLHGNLRQAHVQKFTGIFRSRYQAHPTLSKWGPHNIHTLLLHRYTRHSLSSSCLVADYLKQWHYAGRKEGSKQASTQEIQTVNYSLMSLHVLSASTAQGTRHKGLPCPALNRFSWA